jgi:hypothetical protein
MHEDKQLHDYFFISSYCLTSTNGQPESAIASQSTHAWHVIGIESLTNYVPYDLKLKSSFSNTTQFHTNKSLAFDDPKVSALAPFWNASFVSLTGDDDEQAWLKWKSIKPGTPVEISSGEVEYKLSNPNSAVNWTQPSAALLQIELSFT